MTDWKYGVFIGMNQVSWLADERMHKRSSMIMEELEERCFCFVFRFSTIDDTPSLLQFRNDELSGNGSLEVSTLHSISAANFPVTVFPS